MIAGSSGTDKVSYMEDPYIYSDLSFYSHGEISRGTVGVSLAFSRIGSEIGGGAEDIDGSNGDRINGDVEQIESTNNSDTINLTARARVLTPKDVLLQGGNDSANTVNGRIDRVFCHGGDDTVTVDYNDVVWDCEHVTRRRSLKRSDLKLSPDSHVLSPDATLQRPSGTGSGSDSGSGSGAPETIKPSDQQEAKQVPDVKIPEPTKSGDPAVLKFDSAAKSPAPAKELAPNTKK